MVRWIVGQHDFNVIFVSKFDHAFHELRSMTGVTAVSIYISY
jgi:hypothetical protein